MRSRVTGLILALLSSSMMACSEPVVAQSLVLVTLDTLRRDHVGAYGSTAGLTLHLDALAHSGLVHESAFTTIPTTAPALASLFTGLYPHEHQVRGNGFRLPARFESGELAVRLRDAGYATAAFVSTPLLAPRATQFKGFEVYDHPSEPLRHGQDVVEAAARWLAAERRRPVFLWVHLYDPHAPYGDAADKAAGLPVDPRTHGFVDRGAFAQASERERMAALYAKGVAAVDAALGTLMVDVRVRLDDPLIVVVADHGEALDEYLDERGYAFDHGEFLDDEAIHVPLIVSGPGVPAGRSPGVASIRDVYTTLLLAAGIGDADAESAGRRDLRRRWDEGGVARVERRPLHKSELFTTGKTGWDLIASHAIAVSDSHRTVVVGEDGSVTTANEDDGSELVAAALEHLASVLDRPAHDSLAPVDPSIREALRSLGYAR